MSKVNFEDPEELDLPKKEKLKHHIKEDPDIEGAKKRREQRARQRKAKDVRRAIERKRSK